MLVVTLKCNEVAKSFNLVVPDGTTFAEVWDSQQHWFNYGDRVELSTDDGATEVFYCNSRQRSDGYYHVVVDEWCIDGDYNIEIRGVTTSFEQAKRIVNNFVSESIELARDQTWTVFTDEPGEYDAGEDGNYVANHTRIYIQRL